MNTPSTVSALTFLSTVISVKPLRTLVITSVKYYPTSYGAARCQSLQELKCLTQKNIKYWTSINQPLCYNRLTCHLYIQVYRDSYQWQVHKHPHYNIDSYSCYHSNPMGKIRYSFYPVNKVYILIILIYINDILLTFAFDIYNHPAKPSSMS